MSLLRWYLVARFSNLLCSIYVMVRTKSPDCERPKLDFGTMNNVFSIRASIAYQRVVRRMYVFIPGSGLSEYSALTSE